MANVMEFTEHTARVLYMAKDPIEDTIVSASADETLRFWNVFNSKDTTKSSFSELPFNFR